MGKTTDRQREKEEKKKRKVLAVYELLIHPVRQSGKSIAEPICHIGVGAMTA